MCRLSSELQTLLCAAQTLRSPDALNGLSEAAKRIQAQQQQEAVLKIERSLHKHIAVCDLCQGLTPEEGRTRRTFGLRV